MLRFRCIQTFQKLASVRASVFSHFNQTSVLSSRTILKLNGAAALAEWSGLCAA